MNILFICSRLDGSAGGVVAFELACLIAEMGHTLSILSSATTFNIAAPAKLYGIKSTLEAKDRWSKFLFIVTGREFHNQTWIAEGMDQVEKMEERPVLDFTFCVTSAGDYRAMELSRRIYRKYRIPYLIHALDPIPSVAGWGEHPILRRSIIFHTQKYFSDARALSATNPAMLRYQNGLFSAKKPPEAIAVLPNITRLELESEEQYNHEIEVQNESTAPFFLYLGSLYPQRNPRLLLESFFDYTQQGGKANLVIVGNLFGDTRFLNEFEPEFLSDRIKIENWTEEPEKIIKEAAALIDIDANIPEDVFMSSKIIIYIRYHKPILCLTPKESPVRSFLKDCKQSIVFAEHDRSTLTEQFYILEEMSRQKTEMEERQLAIAESGPEYARRSLNKLFAYMKAVK